MAAIRYEFPETSHPSFSDSAVAAIRGGMERGDRHFEAFAPPKISTDFYADSEEKSVGVIEPTRILFTVEKAFGRAPFVGDPQLEEAAYFWRIARDEYGRWIAGPASLEWRRM